MMNEKFSHLRCIYEFFEDENCKFSMMRLQSFLLMASGIVYAFVTKDPAITAILISAAVGGKIGQKFGEK